MPFYALKLHIVCVMIEHTRFNEKKKIKKNLLPHVQFLISHAVVEHIADIRSSSHRVNTMATKKFCHASCCFLVHGARETNGSQEETWRLRLPDVIGKHYASLKTNKKTSGRWTPHRISLISTAVGTNNQTCFFIYVKPTRRYLAKISAKGTAIFVIFYV